MLDEVSSSLSEPVGYDAVYRLRRSRSTMADDAVAWTTGAAKRWWGAVRPGSPLRILSIGCGDGSLDLPMLEAARAYGPVQYVGCDVNAESLAVFSTALGRRDPDPDLPVTLVHGPFQMLDAGQLFDVVLIAHVLYYVDDPAATVRALLDERCAIDGRVVVIHSGHHGVPAMVAAALGDASFVTAEQIAEDLDAAGLTPTTRVLPGRLCIDDAVADTPLGRALLEFLVERASLDEIDRQRLVAEMEARSTTTDDGRWMPEDLVTMEIRNRLRPTAHRTDRIAVDPLEDYHVLAESFDWPERLASLPADAALLDVGCGTGRPTTLRGRRSSRGTAALAGRPDDAGAQPVA